MDAERLFIDTNILVYANASEAPCHKIALIALKQWRESGTEQWISAQVLREYMAILSRPQTFSVPIDSKLLLERVRYFQQRFRVVYETPVITEKLLMLTQNVEVGGKQIHDANIVATMLANNITHLLTHNITDFNRFDDFITVIPLVST